MKRLKRFLQDSRGFTVAELLVSVAILSMLAGVIGTAFSQVLTTERTVVDDGLALNELRKGLSWFTGDVRMASDTDLVDGGEPVSTCTLTWTDEFNDAQVAHSSSYAVVDDRLVRTYDGNAHTVAHRVVSVSFSRSGQTITAQLEVNAAPDITRTLSAKTVMRPGSL